VAPSGRLSCGPGKPDVTVSDICHRYRHLTPAGPRCRHLRWNAHQVRLPIRQRLSARSVAATSSFRKRKMASLGHRLSGREFHFLHRTCCDRRDLARYPFARKSLTRLCWQRQCVTLRTAEPIVCDVARIARTGSVYLVAEASVLIGHFTPVSFYTNTLISLVAMGGIEPVHDRQQRVVSRPNRHSRQCFRWQDGYALLRSELAERVSNWPHANNVPGR